MRDDPAKLARALAEGGGSDHDLVLTSGGVSTGEADHVRDAVEDVGTLVFWRVAIKPGRPVAMGVIRRRPTAAFVGLPGNPVAVFVTFVRVVRPLLLRLVGRARRSRWSRCRCARASPIARRRAGANMCASRSRASRDGVVEAVKYPQEGAGVITSLTETDGPGRTCRTTSTSDRRRATMVGFLPYCGR